MTSREYEKTMLNIETISREIWRQTRSARSRVDAFCYYAGVVEGYLHTATDKQLIEEPKILDAFIHKLGIISEALSDNAVELDQWVGEIKTLITTARALANSEEAGNAEK